MKNDTLFHISLNHWSILNAPRVCNSNIFFSAAIKAGRLNKILELHPLIYGGDKYSMNNNLLTFFTNKIYVNPVNNQCSYIVSPPIFYLATKPLYINIHYIHKFDHHAEVSTEAASMSIKSMHSDDQRCV